jgi:hypothetical protein
VLAVRVVPAELTRLRQVALDLSTFVYVLVDHEERRVGFGT